MKILAREKTKRRIPEGGKQELLRREVAAVVQLLLHGALREIYFDEQNNAVLVLETRTKRNAQSQLRKLPLVQEGFIEFEMMELRPYAGFSRLL